MTNQVELAGRLTRDAEERTMPSGDVLWVVRLSVPSSDDARSGVNWVDCSVWQPRLQRSASTWHQGDQVWLQGALQRRFYRIGGVPQFRLEVVVTRARLVRRA